MHVIRHFFNLCTSFFILPPMTLNVKPIFCFIKELLIVSHFIILTFRIHIHLITNCKYLRHVFYRANIFGKKIIQYLYNYFLNNKFLLFLQKKPEHRVPTCFSYSSTTSAV